MKPFLASVARIWLAAAIAAIAPLSLSAQSSAVSVEVEGGPLWQSFNDVEIPNDGTASRFDLVDIVGSGPFGAGRLYVSWNVGERHGVRLLLAPFALTESGTPSAPLRFAGANYLAGVPVEARYQFSSYRLSYRWRMYSAGRTRAWLGFTAKIRDASIGLTQGTTTSKKDDLGFVPLLHLAGSWRPVDRWTFIIDADGLAGGPGRAVDASVKAGYDLGEGWTVRAGYRTVEGGADVESVYSFTWLHYLALSLGWSP